MSDSNVIARKYANALMPGAEMSARARRSVRSAGASSLDWLRQRMGGLWVGGAMTLTREALHFGANALNAAAHAGNASRSVRLDRVVEVSDRFGWLTRIVDVRTDDGETLTFRCFGAPAFAEQIRKAVQAVRR